MRISAKGRYAFAALVEVARQSKTGELVSVVNISERLGISKIFLEQTMSELKKGGLINSVKGAKGGYQLAKPAHAITALDVLSNVESAILEKADATVAQRAPAVEAALRDLLFEKLDKAIIECLSEVTIRDLLDCADAQNEEQAFMLNM